MFFSIYGTFIPNIVPIYMFAMLIHFDSQQHYEIDSVIISNFIGENFESLRGEIKIQVWRVVSSGLFHANHRSLRISATLTPDLTAHFIRQ